MYHFEIQYTTTLLTQPEGSNSISKFWKSLKMGKGQRAYRPHKLCYAMLKGTYSRDSPLSNGNCFVFLRPIQ